MFPFTGLLIKNFSQLTSRSIPHSTAHLDQAMFFLQAVCRISSRVRGAVVVANVFMKADGKDGVRLNKLIHFLFYSIITGNQFLD